MKQLQLHHFALLFVCKLCMPLQASAQTYNGCSLWMRVWGSNPSPAKMTFGNRLGNTTSGFDSSTSIPIEYREQEVPPPPLGFEAIWAPVRSQQFGVGVRGLLDIQFNGWENSGQKDTFRINFKQSDDPDQMISFKWMTGSYLLAQCDSAVIVYYDLVENSKVRIDMSTRDTLDIPQAGTTGVSFIRIFKYGAHCIDEAEHDKKRLPSAFSLQQNYPNPFNPETRIQYSVRSRRYVIMKIFDVIGREVATLVNEMKEPGEYAVEWDASDVTSGVYFYRLQVGRYVETKKMAVAR